MVNKITESISPIEQAKVINDIIDEMPAAQVQANWNETSTSSKAYIQNKPTIPTVNNATLTIQKNGTTVKTFTANASSNVTCNITVPTKTSDITNDSGYTTNVGTVTKVNNTSPDANGNVTLSIPVAQIQSDWNQTTTTAKDYIKNKPTIPSVGNGTITITQGGTTKGSFTTNQSNNATINLDAGGTGGITDVKVDNTSVVSGGVANIDLTGYAQKSGAIFSGDVYAQSLYQKSTTNPSNYVQSLTAETVGTYSANRTLSNISSTSSPNFDGQFVTIEPVIISTSTAVGSYTLDVSNILPNDNYSYYLMCTITMNTSNDTRVHVGTVSSPLTNNRWYGYLRCTSNARCSTCAFIIPVGTNREIYSQISNAASSSNVAIYVSGYRRIGTNN